MDNVREKFKSVWSSVRVKVILNPQQKYIKRPFCISKATDNCICTIGKLNQYFIILSTNQELFCEYSTTYYVPALMCWNNLSQNCVLWYCVSIPFYLHIFTQCPAKYGMLWITATWDLPNSYNWMYDINAVMLHLGICRWPTCGKKAKTLLADDLNDAKWMTFYWRLKYYE